jgi:hypothetical protein
MWSFGHFLFIISPFVLTILLHKYTKNLEQEQKRKIGIYLSIFAIMILAARNIEIWIRNDFHFDHELLPLQVCHFANFVLLYAFYKRNEVAFSLAFTLNLLAAFLSILFADGLENYTTILNARGFAYIVGHILIVVITLWAFLNDFIFIKLKTLYKTILFVEGMIFFSIFVNNIMYLVYGKYSNYFYTEHPESGTPLEWGFNFGKEYIYGFFKINYVYVISLMILFPLVTYILYQIAKLFKRAE